MKQALLNIDPSEEVEFEVLRHNIGLVPIIATGVTVVGLLLSAPLFYRGDLFRDTFGSAVDSGWLVAILYAVAALVLIMTFVSVYIYRNNELVITNENLIQLQQTSLFNTAVSQLSLEKVQDVTAVQSGFFATMFNFGSIQVETAGEKANFSFNYARNPVIAAKQINEAHERFIKKYGIDVI